MNALALLAAALPAVAVARAPASRRDPVAVTVAGPAEVAAGATFPVSVRLKTRGGWELHPRTARWPWVPTELALNLPDGFEPAGPWRGPAPVPSARPGGGGVLPADAAFARPVTAPPAPGIYTVACRVRYQACDDRRCLRPVERTLAVRVSVR